MTSCKITSVSYEGWECCGILCLYTPPAIILKRVWGTIWQFTCDGNFEISRRDFVCGFKETFRVYKTEQDTCTQLTRALYQNHNHLWTRWYTTERRFTTSLIGNRHDQPSTSSTEHSPWPTYISKSPGKRLRKSQTFVYCCIRSPDDHYFQVLQFYMICVCYNTREKVNWRKR